MIVGIEIDIDEPIRSVNAPDLSMSYMVGSLNQQYLYQ